jgi:hypothetical protein
MEILFFLIVLAPTAMLIGFIFDMAEAAAKRNRFN